MNLPERLYRSLLHAYPRSFRDRYGAEMVELFSVRYERARVRRARIGFWWEAWTDLFVNAGHERLSGERPSAARPKKRKGLRVDAFVSDLKLAFRRMSDAPGFTAMALLILGLGIGVNVAMFSVVETFLFRSPPWERPEELVWIYQDSDEGDPTSCSFPAYRDIARHENVFSGVAAIIPGREARYLAPSGDAQLVNVTYATSSLFPVLGLAPSRGRWLDKVSDVPGGEPTGVVSHRAWQRRFGADPQIVGRQVKLSGASVTIVGVGPSGYYGETAGDDVDFWLSLAASGTVGGNFYWETLERREDHWFLVLGRRRPEVSERETESAMNVLATRFAADFPQFDQGRGIAVLPAADVRIHPEYDLYLFPAGSALLGVAALVLLVACSNLANLLLSRASVRGKEIAIRLSMGASRSRLVRQLLTESTVLSMGGGLLGLLFAVWAGRALLTSLPPLPVPMRLEVTLDARLLLTALVVAVLTGIAFGLVPALRASRPDLAPQLKFGAEGSSEFRHRFFNLRNALVAIQVATSIVLLVGAGLLVRSLVNAETAELGFRSRELSVLQVDVGEAGYEGESATRFVGQLVERIEGRASVEEVSLTTRLPVTPEGASTTLEIEGYESATGSNKAEVSFAYVDPDYFETLGIPLLHGRAFTDTDRAETERVTVVSEAFAREYWGSSDVVGRRYRHEGRPDSWVRIVGVVSDTKVRTPDEGPTPILFRPLAQTGGVSRLYVVARATGSPESLVGTMRDELRNLDADVPVYQAGAMEDHVAVALSMPRAAAATLGLLSALALLLASMGLYAVVSFAVSRRRFEIAIRMALGASGPRVVATVMRETVAVAIAGVLAGLLLSLLLTPLLESVLFGIAALDPLTFTGVGVLMIGVAALAAYLPARRAAATDPVRALRFE